MVVCETDALPTPEERLLRGSIGGATWHVFLTLTCSPPPPPLELTTPAERVDEREGSVLVAVVTPTLLPGEGGGADVSLLVVVVRLTTVVEVCGVRVSGGGWGEVGW